MSKKSFKGGFDLILGESLSESQSVPAESQTLVSTQIETKELTNLPSLSTKITLRVNSELLQKAKDLAYWERMTLTETISRALDEYVNNNSEKILKVEKK